MIRKFYLLSLAIMLSTAGSFAQAVSTYGQLGVNGTNLVDKNDNPVQLQGMSLFWSNWYEGYDYWNEDVVTKLKNDWCINVIRAAMGVDEDNGYISQPSTNLTRVETIIDAAIANDIYVIVDYHSHYAHNYKSQAITFFKYIANKYKDYDNIIYEVYNEPIYSDWNSTIKPYCEDVIDEIRAIDANNVIICGSRLWDQRPDEAADNPITGETNIAYSLHFYAGSHGDQERSYAQDAINKGLCLFVTEWGTVNADGDGSANTTETAKWFDFIEDNNLSHCNWSVTNKNEGASILKSSVSSKTGNWSNSDYTTSGTWVKNYLNDHCPNYGTNAPTITKDVADETIYDGYDATFKVFASGGDLSFQWYNDDGIINGATSNTYTIDAATSSDEMDYWVVITNSIGSVTSGKGALIINSSTPYGGSPHAIPGIVNAADFDEGDNYLTNTSSASYYDTKEGNDIPTSAEEYNNYRPDTDGDFGSTWEADYGDVNTLGYLADEEWFNYTIDVSTSTYYNIEIRTISGNSGGKINLEFNGQDETGTLDVPVDAAYWPLQGLNVSNVYLEAGVQIMRLNIIATSEMSIANIVITKSPDVDCNNELNGSAFIDDCDVCVGGSTGLAENSLCEQDCDGEWGGDAYLDDCDICVGGTTGETECDGDSDNDGVDDSVDECLNTPAGENANSSGCSPSQLDTDNDGVSDEDDLCANTSAGVNVDATGCEIASGTDDDNDGVDDSVDECLNTPAGENANSSGCSPSQLDSDNDGVSDEDDVCPNSAANESVDATGCPANGVSELQSEGVYVFPIPANDILTIKQESLKYSSAVITDLTGTIVKSVIISSDVEAIDVSNLATGVYIVSFSGVNGTSQLQIIIE